MMISLLLSSPSRLAPMPPKSNSTRSDRKFNIF